MNTDKPWEIEPNYKVWFDKRTGLRCMVKRAHGGHLCGYVRIPRKLRKKIVRGRRGNFKIHKFDERSLNIPIHGGVSFLGKFKPGGLRKNGYWVGLDCNHHFDYSPKYPCWGCTPDMYKTWDEVKEYTERLAWKLHLYINSLKRLGKIK